MEVEIWLVDPTPEVLAALAKVGFVDSGVAKVAKIRTGRIALEQLEALAALDSVVAVKPARSR